MIFQDIRSAINELKGSGKLEVSPYQANPVWSRAGALTSIAASIERKVANIERANAAPEPALASENMTISAEVSELLHSSVFDLILGITGKTIIAGTPVVGATQTFAGAVAGLGYVITFNNADGSAPTITACVNTDTATAYALYHVSKVGGLYYIEFDTTGDYQITVNYTPIASIQYAIGSELTPPLFMARITTKSDNGVMHFVVYCCANTGNLEFKYSKDTDADRALKYTLKLEAYPDYTYHTDAQGNGLLGYLDAPFLP
jgi:hypothetical protein